MPDTKQLIQTMPTPLHIDYGKLADLFYYPENESYRAKITSIYTYLLQASNEAGKTMQVFIDFMETSSLQDMQELFLRSFDVQAITTLDIGFVLFGEDYKRGKLLVHLNKEHNEVANKCGTELSDHLPNLLNLLGKMKDQEIRDEIAVRLILPAVEKMIREFSSEKIEKKDGVYKKHQKVLLDYSKNYRTIYQTLLEALFVALQKDYHYESENYEELIKNAGNSDDQSFFSPKNTMVSKPENDFAQNIETEMLTDK